jgi:Flp pilus assembly protein TadB
VAGHVRFARIWLPLSIAAAGVVLILTGGDDAVGAGVLLIGVSVLVVLANLMLRLSLSSERDREQEEANREFFSRTGHWPDERP